MCCTASACSQRHCSCGPTDLAALVRAVQQLLMPVAASRGLHLHSEIDPMLQQWSLADGLRLRQVLFNLAGNALKFTLQEAWCCRSMCCSSAMGQRLRLQVTDTGVGISMERQQAVFAAYEQAETSTTRRFGGSGLGLSICRELAASMGGQLHLRSAPGKGTTVWLELVLAACGTRRWYRCSRRPCNGRCRRPARALVVEDHPTNLQLLVQRLRELGLQVHACDATASRHGRPGRRSPLIWSSPTAKCRTWTASRWHGRSVAIPVPPVRRCRSSR